MLQGAQPVPETATFYVLYEDGSSGEITVSGGGTPELAKPGRIVPAKKYQARLTDLRAHHEEQSARLVADDEDRTRGDYEALKAAGVAEGTARRMSGWNGTAEGAG